MITWDTITPHDPNRRIRERATRAVAPVIVAVPRPQPQPAPQTRQRGRGRKSRPPKPTAPAAPVALPCVHRGDKIGRLVCNCVNKQDVFACTAWDVGACIAQPVTSMADAPIAGCGDERYYPWTSEQGDTLGEFAPFGKGGGPVRRIPACSLCPRLKAPAVASVAVQDGSAVEILNPAASICVVTGYTPQDPTWQAIGELTSQTMRDYCQRHGYGFRCHTGGFEPDIAPSWSKVKWLREALQHHETVLWIDADAAVTNHYTRIEDLHLGPEELVLCTDPIDINCGVILLRRSAFATWYLDQLWSDRLLKNKLWEQDTTKAMFHRGSLARHLAVREPRAFNSENPKQHGVFFEWQPGDFICHAYATGSGHNATKKLAALQDVIGRAYRGVDAAMIAESRRFAESLVGAANG